VVIHQGDRSPHLQPPRLLERRHQQPHRPIQGQLRDFFFKSRCVKVTNRCASPTRVMW
jgi:hypothetical protein